MARPERTLPTGVRGKPGDYWAVWTRKGKRHRAGPYFLIATAEQAYAWGKRWQAHVDRRAEEERHHEQRQRALPLFGRRTHMEVSPILGPNGQPVFTIGGDLAHAVHAYRGWVCSLEWVKRRRRYVRVLVIWPEVPNALPGTTAPGAWTITESAITELLDVDSYGKATGTFRQPFADSQARAALVVMGRDPNDRNAVSSLLDAVMRYGPDVFVMPHAPRRVQEKLSGAPMWDVRARAAATGRTLHEGSV